MNVKIVAKKLQPGESFEKHAQSKLKKLDRFFGEAGEAKIVIEPIRENVLVELTVNHGSLTFRAENSSNEKEAALDECVDLITRQIRKNKTKVEKRLKDTAFADSFAEPAVEESIYEITRRKSFVLRPMVAEEAILQMDMLGHAFFVYKNAETGQTNVVYKRNNGSYAVIEPEIS
jgi:putative sigma-54 modulation protein